MKLWQHMLVQFVLVVLQGANAEMFNVSSKWRPLVVLVISAGQMTLAGYQAFYNPDGTSAKTAYVPATKP
jgi:hypothetical protein